MINIGSIWKKVAGDWGREKGQLVIVESIRTNIVYTNIGYRYTSCAIYHLGERSIIDFKERFRLIRDV